MPTDRVREFTRDGRNFVYVDFSGLKTASEYRTVSEPAAETIAKYPKESLLTVTDISDIGFDAEVQGLMAKYMMGNGPYVKHGAVVGVDGIKGAVLKTVFLLSRRRNMACFGTKEEAIEWLLGQE